MATDGRRLHAIVLSPHFDDAAFSCGGIIKRWTNGGQRVVVITVCAAPPAGPLSPYAASLHRRWGAAPGEEQADARAMVARRRAEDEAALAILGAEGIWLDVPDCIYRTGPEASWLYEGDDAIFGAVAAGDGAAIDGVVTVLDRLAGNTPRTRILVPLTVGGHVDHQLVRAAAERWSATRRGGAALRYYEDYPYARDDEAVAAALGDPPAWRPHVGRLAEVHLAARVAAMAAYESQISSFWPDAAAMGEEVRAYAWRRGEGRWPAERLWERVGAEGPGRAS